MNGRYAYDATFPYEALCDIQLFETLFLNVFQSACQHRILVPIRLSFHHGEYEVYEDKKTKTSRRISFRVFADLPGIARAFLNLFIIMLLSIILFSFLDKSFDVPIFEQVAEELTSFLKLVIGAIIGSLTSEAKNYLQRQEA